MENIQAKLKAYKELLIAKQNANKKRIKLIIGSMLMYAIPISLIVYWFDWKLLLVFLSWGAANNFNRSYFKSNKH